MSTTGHEHRAAATGALLQTLLSTRPEYIRAWRVHGDRNRGKINQRAVARVLALYMWDQGLRPDTEVDLPTQLKNVVNRALLGQRLTSSGLECFIGAFNMTEEDQVALWGAYSGSSGIAYTLQTPRTMAKRQWHRTAALFERYYIDDDRCLSLRRVAQCLEAQEDGVDSYLFNHEHFVTEIEVVHGGSLGRHYEYGEGLVADDIVFDRSLESGERTAIEYLARYEPSNLVTEVRRPARARTSNVTLAVHFSPRAVPAVVWFSVWSDHLLGGAVTERVVPLARGASASVCLHYIEQTVVGFRWQW